jgi:hypothetical protein
MKAITFIKRNISVFSVVIIIMIFGLLSDIFQYNLNILKDAITLIFLFSIIILFSIDLVLKGIIKNRITLNIIELFLIILIFSIRYI